jgi:P27 family predicted phage terminase small subunit
LKRLQGTARPDRVNANEPQPDPAIPTRPGWFLPEAKREWNRVVPGLSKLGLLTALDRGAIAGGCQWWAMFVDAVKDIEENGTTFMTDTGYQGPRPSVALALKSWQQYLAFAARFGLTPSDRSRLSVPAPKPIDEMSAYLDRVRFLNEPVEDTER